MSKIIGIDLGTTNSVVAIMEGSEVKVIVNPQGARTTPSVVGFKEDGERVVGQPAKNQAVTNPENTVFSVKRFMGRRRGEVIDEEKLVPFKITGGPEENVSVSIRGKSYEPPEISAMILTFLKTYAEDYLGEPVTEAVITVPAYFNDAQRNATKVAGEIAGLKVRRIINEPTAAALAYGLDKKKGEKILIYDLGGGTFDVSVLDIGTDSDGDRFVTVKSTNGDTHLGGDDYDQVLIDYACDEFKKIEGNKKIDLRKDRMALQRLKEACEKCKCELSTTLTATINLPFICAGDGGGKHLQMEITRAKFEILTAKLTERTRGPVEKALADAKIAAKDIGEVVLVGGSTRIPAVQELVKSMFGGKEPNKSVNPDEVVAAGAAIQGAILAGEKKGLLLLDVTPLSLGIETKGGVMNVMIPRNTTIPTNKTDVFSTAETDQNSVDIKIFQGERKMTDSNRFLGTFKLSGIRPAPVGVPRIEVKFDVDADGIIHVSAKDLATKNEEKIRVTSDTGLSKADIERMKHDAEANAASDEKRFRLVELKNKVETLVFDNEQLVAKAAISAESRKKLQDAIAELKKSRDAGDPDAIEKNMTILVELRRAANAEIFAGPKKAAGSTEEPASPAAETAADATAAAEKDDDEVEAEFKVNE
jgi:molecular chaperone DnaK